MSVRNFDGVDDYITTALGSLGFAFGPGTMAAIFRKADDSGSETLLYVGSATTLGNRYSLFFAGATTPTIRCGSGTVNSPLLVEAADDWVFVAVTKATGTVTPRWHRYVFGTSTWTHQDAGSTLVNSGTPANSARIGATTGPNTFFHGDMGIAGVASVVLTDLEIEELVTEEAAWAASGMVAVWPLTQASAATAVQDTVGAADETAITGTSVTASDIPWTNSTTPVAASFVCALDAPQKVTLAPAIGYEAQGEAQALRTGSVDAHGNASKVVGVPYEALAVTISATFTGSWDAVLRVDSETAGFAEALAAITAPWQIPIEAGGEALLIAAFDLAWESVTALSAEFTGNIDSVQPLAVTWTLQVDAPGSVSALRQLPVEAGGEARLISEFICAWESTTAVVAQRTGNVESTGPRVAVTYLLPLESLIQAETALMVAPWEAPAGVRGIVVAPYESAPRSRVRRLRPGTRDPDIAVAPGTRRPDVSLTAGTRTPTTNLEVT